jgi:hypothetical protein
LLYEGIAELLGQDFHKRYEEIYSYDNHFPIFGSDELFKGEIHIRLWEKRNVGPSVGLELFVEDGMLRWIHMFCLAELTVRLGQKSSLSAIGIARHVSQDPLSPHSIALGSAWLKECAEDHEFCTVTPKTISPTRLLHVGSEDKHPHLVTNNGKVRSQKYVALSYCWGKTLPMTTTTANLDEMEQGIPFSTLPSTLQDAVSVARAFGVTYLWVDALCIIQDSNEDWIHEAAQMGDIFANAYFVIRAEAGVDCQSGFLFPRNSTGGTKTVVGFESSTRSLTTNGVFMRRRRERGYDAVAHTSDKMRSQLSTRAWAFQERYRAARSLIFGHEEMAWECQTMTRCECKSGHQPSRTSFHQLDWRSTVETYSALKLTKSEDRLPAFSGIAETFHKARRTIAGNRPSNIIKKGSEYTDYIGGIWGTEIAQQLMWYLKNDDTGSRPFSKRHASYQAPSWSWASITGPITYHHHDVDEKGCTEFIVEDVKWAAATLNPYGAVSQAQMKAKGRIIPVRIFPPNKDTYTVSQFLCPKTAGGANVRLPFIADVTGFEAGSSGLEAYYFIIIVLTDTLYAGLVLKETQTAPETMERVGFCCGNTVYDDLSDGVPNHLSDYERVGRVSKYLRTYSELRTITII